MDFKRANRDVGLMLSWVLSPSQAPEWSLCRKNMTQNIVQCTHINISIKTGAVQTLKRAKVFTCGKKRFRTSIDLCLQNVQKYQGAERERERERENEGEAERPSPPLDKWWLPRLPILIPTRSPSVQSNAPICTCVYTRSRPLWKRTGWISTGVTKTRRFARGQMDLLIIFWFSLKPKLTVIYVQITTETSSDFTRLYHPPPLPPPHPQPPPHQG